MRDAKCEMDAIPLPLLLLLLLLALMVQRKLVALRIKIQRTPTRRMGNICIFSFTFAVTFVTPAVWYSYSYKQKHIYKRKHQYHARKHQYHAPKQK